ncbi:hypothetical protein [Nocardioides sp.]|uniref:hypothetical protein n=1 Tax=Nocardioides sp. TaxID=35761 RepID=UPI002B270EE2|nr:hypothetical protein [Nocardioides sp.]
MFATPDEGRLPGGLVLPVRCAPTDPTGPTRKEARGPRWRRTSHGYYVPASTPTDDVRQRIVEASVLVKPGSAINGWAALCWLGGRWFDGSTARLSARPVSIVTSTHDIRRQPGIAPSAEGFDPRMVLWVDGLPVADPRYATSFEMRYAVSDLDAVKVLDAAAYSDLVSIAEMAAFLETQYGWTGVPRARRAVPRADENCWSLMEVELRDVWTENAGLRRPLCNQPIFDVRTGAHIGTPDVFDPVAGVAGEYDGDLHLVRSQRDRDLRREGVFRAHNLEVVTMTASDRRDPWAFVGRLHTAYRHAERHPVEDRTWTIEQPHWWTDASTVAARRAMTADQRRRFLAHRVA